MKKTVSPSPASNEWRATVALEGGTILVKESAYDLHEFRYIRSSKLHDHILKYAQMHVIQLQEIINSLCLSDTCIRH